MALPLQRGGEPGRAPDPITGSNDRIINHPAQQETAELLDRIKRRDDQEAASEFVNLSKRFYYGVVKPCLLNAQADEMKPGINRGIMEQRLKEQGQYSSLANHLVRYLT